MAEKIKVYRFMSDVEHFLLLEGRTIHNHTDYRKYRKGKSTVKGFSFGIGDKDMAVKASRRLKGVAYMQWLLVAEVDKGCFLDAQGFYPVFNDAGYQIGGKWYDELCLEQYALNNPDYYKFYLVRGISDRSREVVIGGASLCSRREQNNLKIANRVANETYMNILAGMDPDDFTRWHEDMMLTGKNAFRI